MSRLQILVPAPLERRVRKAAQRRRLSTSAWVREAIERALAEILYRYAALKRRDLAAEVYELFVQVCPIVLPLTIADTDRARTLITARADIGVHVRRSV
jgi:cytidylate kinase